jgi:hypothetical protein
MTDVQIFYSDTTIGFASELEKAFMAAGLDVRSDNCSEDIWPSSLEFLFMTSKNALLLIGHEFGKLDSVRDSGERTRNYLLSK